MIHFDLYNPSNLLLFVCVCMAVILTELWNKTKIYNSIWRNLGGTDAFDPVVDCFSFYRSL
jgi:hypothetical protein